MKGSGRWVRAGSLALAFAAFCSVILPWFKLPVLGWGVPAPAWNRTGLLLLALAACQLSRALGWSGAKWMVRLVCLPALYLWWGSEEVFRHWGTATLAPLQLKLAALNDVLGKFSVEAVEIFEPRLWKQLETGPGWYLAGGTLVCSLLLSAFDRVKVSSCPACALKVAATDCHCPGCGHKFRDFQGCSKCGRHPQAGDKFCRDCGESVKRPD